MLGHKNLHETILLQKCISNDKKAEHTFYERYSQKLIGTCLRYAKNPTDAEDILQEGFIKIFKYLGDYRGEGSFEGWMRRIMVTTALNFYKKKNLINKNIDFEDVRVHLPNEHEILSKMSHEELMSIVGGLPDGYRRVFHLNILEGYSHKEIGKMMNISVNTSKSQLSRARGSLKTKIIDLLAREEAKINFAALLN